MATSPSEAEVKGSEREGKRNKTMRTRPKKKSEGRKLLRQFSSDVLAARRTENDKWVVPKDPHFLYLCICLVCVCV